MPTEGTRAFDGVPVREVEALELAVAICFVGDFVGDYDDKALVITGDGTDDKATYSCNT